MIVQLENCTNVLLSEVATPEAKRNDIALTYAMALSSPDTDWGKVNEAILGRWSFSGLEYIKNRAWKLRRGAKPDSTALPATENTKTPDSGEASR